MDLSLVVRDGALTFAVTDDGRAFVASAALPGAGTHNMRDRLEALGGALSVTSAPGAGTTVSGEVPALPRPGPHPGFRCRAPDPPDVRRGADMRLARHAWIFVVLTAALAAAQAALLRAGGVPLLSATAVGNGFPGITVATVVGCARGSGHPLPPPAAPDRMALLPRPARCGRRPGRAGGG